MTDAMRRMCISIQMYAAMLWPGGKDGNGAVCQSPEKPARRNTELVA
jgi:hypothetical protein